MKKIFTWLLKKYSKTEKERIEILKVMNDNVFNNYPEQNSYGNFYNYSVEFIMSNPLIVECSKKNFEKGLIFLKENLTESFDDAIKYIKEENKENENSNK